MTYTNAQILAAVINRWAAPLITSIIESSVSQMPFIANLESKVRSTGWVSGNWSITRELTPLMGNMTSVIVEPMLTQYIGNIPDAAIPQVAHTFVDNALRNGKLELMEGKVTFEKDDLELLKRLLNLNLPVSLGQGYEVKVEPTNTEQL